MMTGPGGREFAFVERLEEIAKRFLKKTATYKKSVVEVEKLKKRHTLQQNKIVFYKKFFPV